MAIVAGFDVHRAQITFDALDTDSGEVTRGRIDATPAAVARWTERFGGAEVDVAVEACTGWLRTQSAGRSDDRCSDAYELSSPGRRFVDRTLHCPLDEKRQSAAPDQRLLLPGNPVVRLESVVVPL